jgi:hypothetical protein
VHCTHQPTHHHNHNHLAAGNGFADDLNPNELVSINLMGPGNVEIMVRARLRACL